MDNAALSVWPNNTLACDAWHHVSANVLLFNSSQTLLRIDACRSCYMMSKLMTATGTPADIKNNG